MYMQQSKSQETLLNRIKERNINMWNVIIDRLTDVTTMVCTILSFVIPLTVYKINKIFHQNTDPSWKKNNSQ